jgi:predicted transcriptional regulator
MLMGLKLFDSEMKVMDIIWREGDVPASYIAEVLLKRIGWNKNTTYTVIKKCIAKNAIERRDPNFICHGLVGREDVQNSEVDELINKLFDGSAEMLFASLLSRKNLPDDVLARLKDMVEEQKP